MTDRAALLSVARSAHRERRWAEAHAAFTAAVAEDEESVGADDLAGLALAAWWLGRFDETVAVGAAAVRAFERAGRVRPAAMSALGVAATSFLRGDDAAGSQWRDRAARLLADEPECPEQGYVRHALDVEAHLDGPDLRAVAAAARHVGELGRRHGDPDLVALGLLGEGRALVRRGDVRAGVALLEEAMAHVRAGDVSPEWTGYAYRHLMAASTELADPVRARVWVEAMRSWLETLPVAVYFTGVLRVYRAELLEVSGAWDESRREALRVCGELSGVAGPTAAEGHYRLAEVARLRGDLAAAEPAYGEAHARGRDPEPGLSLLRLAQERREEAAASIRAAVLGESANRLRRARLLTAQVEIALGAEDVVGAGDAVAELAGISETFTSPGFTAAARHWHGAVLLAEGHVREALPWLRAAMDEWRALDAPYHSARARWLLAQGYEALGDHDGAAHERGAADEVFARLGAAREPARWPGAGPRDGVRPVGPPSAG
ncbi:hypothetical protein ACI8AF_18915 [Blastococcus sp. SYSU D00669]